MNTNECRVFVEEKICNLWNFTCFLHCVVVVVNNIFFYFYIFFVVVISKIFFDIVL